MKNLIDFLKNEAKSIEDVLNKAADLNDVYCEGAFSVKENEGYTAIVANGGPEEINGDIIGKVLLFEDIKGKFSYMTLAY